MRGGAGTGISGPTAVVFKNSANNADQILIRSTIAHGSSVQQ
jgi:hypothetical protein